MLGVRLTPLRQRGESDELALAAAGGELGGVTFLADAGVVRDQDLSTDRRRGGPAAAVGGDAGLLLAGPGVDDPDLADARVAAARHDRELVGVGVVSEDLKAGPVGRVED